MRKKDIAWLNQNPNHVFLEVKENRRAIEPYLYYYRYVSKGNELYYNCIDSGWLDDVIQGLVWFIDIEEQSNKIVKVRFLPSAVTALEEYRSFNQYQKTIKQYDEIKAQYCRNQ